MAGVQGSALAIAVSNAGGLGSLPCATLSLDQIRKELAAITAATSKPYNVNFFVHRQPQPDEAREAAWRKVLAPYYAELGIDQSAIQGGPGRLPFSDEAADVLEEFKPPVVSFHFGLPSEAQVARVKRWGAKILSSATTVEEARWLEARGVDAVIAQGLEAGGHRGIFLSEDLDTQVGTFALVRQIAKAVRVPVIAAGGIADADGVKAALQLGAAGVQVGTAYLLCPEATTTAIHRAALKSDSRRGHRAHQRLHRPSGARDRQSPDARDRADEQRRASVSAGGIRRPAVADERRGPRQWRLLIAVGGSERVWLSTDTGCGIHAVPRGRSEVSHRPSVLLLNQA